MCVAGEEEGSGSAGSGTTSGGAIPEIVATAPRLGLNLDVYQSIDWSEVFPITVIGAAAGLYSGGLGGAVVGAAAAGAGAIESQDDVDLVDLFEIQNDMIIVPGVPGGYLSLH